MPNQDALKSGLFCAQCGRDMPENRLFLLYAKKAPTEFVPTPEFEYVGRYCDECIPREEKMERSINGAVECRTEPFSSGKIERK